MGTKSYIYRGTGDLDPLKSTEPEPPDAQPLNALDPGQTSVLLPSPKGEWPNPGGRRSNTAKELDAMLKQRFPPEYMADKIEAVLMDPTRQDYTQMVIYVVNRQAGTPVQKVDLTLPEDDIRHQVAAARLALLTALKSPAPDANAIDADYKELPEGT